MCYYCPARSSVILSRTIFSQPQRFTKAAFEAGKEIWHVHVAISFLSNSWGTGSQPIDRGLGSTPREESSHADQARQSNGRQSPKSSCSLIWNGTKAKTSPEHRVKSLNQRVRIRSSPLPLCNYRGRRIFLLCSDSSPLWV